MTEFFMIFSCTQFVFFLWLMVQNNKELNEFGDSLNDRISHVLHFGSNQREKMCRIMLEFEKRITYLEKCLQRDAIDELAKETQEDLSRLQDETISKKNESPLDTV